MQPSTDHYPPHSALFEMPCFLKCFDGWLCLRVWKYQLSVMMIPPPPLLVVLKRSASVHFLKYLGILHYYPWEILPYSFCSPFPVLVFLFFSFSLFCVALFLLTAFCSLPFFPFLSLHLSFPGILNRLHGRWLFQEELSRKFLS